MYTAACKKKSKHCKQIVTKKKKKSKRKKATNKKGGVKSKNKSKGDGLKSSTRKKKKKRAKKKSRKKSVKKDGFGLPKMETTFLPSKLQEFCMDADEYSRILAHVQSLKEGGRGKYPAGKDKGKKKQNWDNKCKKYCLRNDLLTLKDTTHFLKVDKQFYDAKSKKTIILKKGKVLNLRKYGKHFSDDQYTTFTTYRVVVTPEMVPKIWHDYHEAFACPGQETTRDTIKQHYHFTKLVEFVKYAKSIAPCCQRKQEQNKENQGEPRLRPLPIPSDKFYEVHLDFAGPFPLSKNGNRYILIATDRLTRFPEVAALPDQTAEQVCKFIFDEIFMRYGMMKVFIHDNGKSFIEQYNAELLASFGIKRRCVLPYRPRGNGAAESMVKTIKTAILSHIQHHQAVKKNRKWKKGGGKWSRYWDTQVKPAAFFARASWTRTRKMSPIEAMHGRKPFMPGDWDLLGDESLDAEYEEEEIDVKTATDVDMTDLDDFEKHQIRLNEIAEQLAATYQTTQERYIKKYNKRRGLTYDPQVGDKVLYRKRQKSRFDKKVTWLPVGGFVVIKHIDNAGRVTLMKEKGKEMSQKYPLDFIKKFNTAEDLQKAEENETSTDDGTTEIDVSENEPVIEENKIQETDFIDVLQSYEEKFAKKLDLSSITLDLSSVVLQQSKTWRYIRNGPMFCAFITLIMSLVSNKFFMKSLTEISGSNVNIRFVKQLFTMMNVTVTHALQKKNNGYTTYQCFEMVLELLSTWMALKKHRINRFYTIFEAFNILGLTDETLKRQFQEKNILVRNQVYLKMCVNESCLEIYSAEGGDRISSWKDFDMQALPGFEDAEGPNQAGEPFFEVPSYVFSETNILCGASPQGRCSKCGSCTFTITFRTLSDVILVTFGHYLNFFTNFDVQKLQKVPLIDYEGKIHFYETQSILLNKPSNVHWTNVQLDWKNQKCVQLESLRGGGVLDGKPKRRSISWLQDNKKFIAGLVLTRLRQAPQQQTNPYDVVLSAIKECKLSTKDVKLYPQITWPNFMEHRDLWTLFEEDVNRITYTSTMDQEIDGVEYKAGDRLKVGRMQLSRLNIPTANYTLRTKPLYTKMKQVLIEWCKQHESHWIQTGQHLSKQQQTTFRERMLRIWEETDASKKGNELECQVDLTVQTNSDTESSHTGSSEVQQLSQQIQSVLQQKQLKVIKSAEHGSIELQGDVSSRNEQVISVTQVSQRAFNKFGRDGWYEWYCKIDDKIKLRKFVPHKTKLKLVRTDKISEIHVIDKLELLTELSDLDEKKAMWFIKGCNKKSHVPDMVFKLSCDPTQSQ